MTEVSWFSVPCHATSWITFTCGDYIRRWRLHTRLCRDLFTASRSWTNSPDASRQLPKGRKSSKDALRQSLLYKTNIFLSIHFFIFVDFLGNRDDSYPQNSTNFLEKIGCFWHFFAILFYSVFMQDFGFRLHFYAFIFPFLLFSASYMHVHTSARLLTYMRVRVSASAYARARKKFFYFSKLWTKFLQILFTSLFVNLRWT